MRRLPALLFLLALGVPGAPGSDAPPPDEARLRAMNARFAPVAHAEPLIVRMHEPRNLETPLTDLFSKETDKFFMRFTQQDLSPKLVVMRFALKQTQNSEGTKYNQVEITMQRPLNTEEMSRMIDIQELWKPYFGQTTLEADDVMGDAGV